MTYRRPTPAIQQTIVFCLLISALLLIVGAANYCLLKNLEKQEKEAK